MTSRTRAQRSALAAGVLLFWWKLQKRASICVPDPRLDSDYCGPYTVTSVETPLPLFTEHEMLLLNLKYYPSPAIRH